MKTKMRLLPSILCLTLFFNFSFAQVKTTLPNEIKMMTTKQYDEKYDVVFKSVMSLLQSEQFAIESADMESGLVIATKNIFNKRKASLTKSVIIIDKLNDELTETKITVYSGSEKTRDTGKKVREENMIQDPAYYKKWFNNLTAEIARRKALM